MSTAFRAWYAAQPNVSTVIILGGGPLVDGLRHLDERLNLDAAVSHRLAIELTDVAAQLFHHLVPECGFSTDLPDVTHLATARPTVFAAARFLEHEEGHFAGDRLSVGWSVTSDSIAARIATILTADELVLLKSAAPANVEASPSNWDRLATDGYVDAAFPRYAAGCRSIRLVNLRSWSENDSKRHEVD